MIELTKNDTKMLQGLSVLAMVCLHLFCTNDYARKFTPIVFAGGVPISFYLAQLSDFCVFGFAFCSGYGHYAQYGKAGFYKQRLKGLLLLVCSYWVILVLFSIVSIVIGQGNFMPGRVSKFVRNSLMLENSYNGAHWYMFAYVVLAIVSPMLLKLVKKTHPIIVLGIGFVVYCAAYYVRFKYPVTNWFLGKFGPFGMTLFEYLIGAVCYRIKFVSFSHTVWKKAPKLFQVGVSIVVFVALLYARTKIVPSLFVAPASGLVLMLLFHFWEKPRIVEKFFYLIGEHSTNIWLTHMFFYIAPFKGGGVYTAKYPPLIYVFMIVITMAVSSMLKVIEKPLQKKIYEM